MILSERHIIKKTNSLYSELDNLCLLSKNIYNSALYAIRQYYFEKKEIPQLGQREQQLRKRQAS